jgi:hypothetical protein
MMRDFFTTPLRALRDRLSVIVDDPLIEITAAADQGVCLHPKDELLDYARMGHPNAKMCRRCGEEV